MPRNKKMELTSTSEQRKLCIPNTILDKLILFQ